MIVGSFFLRTVLPSLNELEAARGKIAAARGTGDRTRQNRYNELKQAAQGAIVAEIRSHRVRRGFAELPRNARVRIEFEWRTADRARDPDNIAAGGRKIILDALARPRPAGADRWTVGAGVLHCDGWHCVAGFRDHFVCVHPRDTGTLVTLELVVA